MRKFIDISDNVEKVPSIGMILFSIGLLPASLFIFELLVMFNK